MFEDLIPPVPPETGALPLGMFDDLIPSSAVADVVASAKLAVPGGADEQTLPRSRTDTGPGDGTTEAPQRNGQSAVALADQTNAREGAAAAPGLFDDLIPATAARSGAAAGGRQGAIAPEYDPVPDPSLGLKDRKTGIPLVRESVPGRFIADVAGEDDGGLFWKDPQTGEIQRPSGNELIRPEGGKYKVYERDENVRPWAWTDMALIQAIKSGFSAPYDALAGNMAPSEVSQRALDFAMLATPGTRFTPSRMAPRTEPTSVRPEPADQLPSRSFSDDGLPRDSQVGDAGANAPKGQDGDPAAAQAPNYHPPDQSGERTRGPPPDQDRVPQNGAPSGAVSIFRGQEVEGIASNRLAGQPDELKNPPIGDDGEKVELHHVGQVQGGRIRAMTQTDHRIGDNFKKNHPNTGKKASLIDRVLSRSFREAYWEQQSREGAFDKLPKLSETQREELRRAARARSDDPASK